ncbi:MAG: hypothetical protein ACREMY_02330 [bacterium]
MPRIPFLQKRPEFPSTDDLCNLPLDDARRALAALRVLVDAELADVYTAAGNNDTRWNVWLAISRRRVPLPQWAAQWVEAWYRNPDGPEAA